MNDGKMADGMLTRQRRIVEVCRRVIESHPDEVAAKKKELLETLKEIFQGSNETDFWNTIMSVRGQALCRRLPIAYIVHLGDCCWIVSEDSEDKKRRAFFGRLSVNLKVKTCELFRCVLTGGEISCRNGTAWKHYNFSSIPNRVRLSQGIKFAISRINTQRILGAYDCLVEEAKEEQNGLMSSHWQTQKEAFYYLVQCLAPKLLVKE